MSDELQAGVEQEDVPGGVPRGDTDEQAPPPTLPPPQSSTTRPPPRRGLVFAALALLLLLPVTYLFMRRPPRPGVDTLAGRATVAAQATRIAGREATRAADLDDAWATTSAERADSLNLMFDEVRATATAFADNAAAETAEAAEAGGGVPEGTSTMIAPGATTDP